MGALVALGTAAAAAGEGDSAPPLPCMHLGGAQLLPRLALAGPMATTTSAGAGKFQLQALPVPPGGRAAAAELAAGLRCRSHGRLVGLAVSAQRRRRSSDDSASSASSGAGEEEPAEAAPAGGEAPAPAPAVLEVWAPEAGRADAWGLYEFEIASGEFPGFSLLCFG